MRIFQRLLLGASGFLMGACAHQETQVAMDRLNHPSMNFERRLTPGTQLPLTQLDEASGSTAAGGCRSCAK